MVYLCSLHIIYSQNQLPMQNAMYFMYIVINIALKVTKIVAVIFGLLFLTGLEYLRYHHQIANIK